MFNFFRVLVVLLFFSTHSFSQADTITNGKDLNANDSSKVDFKNADFSLYHDNFEGEETPNRFVWTEVNGVRQGEFYYLRKDNSVLLRGHYVNGRLHGNVIQFDHNGQIQYLHTVIDGELFSSIEFWKGRARTIHEKMQAQNMSINNEINLHSDKGSLFYSISTVEDILLKGIFQDKRGNTLKITERKNGRGRIFLFNKKNRLREVIVRFN